MFADDPTLNSLLAGAVLAALALVWVVLLVRVVGLRSFSKMTSFDFVMTIAMGSLVGSAARSTTWTDYLQAVAAMASLFLVQWVTANLRNSSHWANRVIQNQPVLLMRDGKVLEEALRATRVSRDSLFEKLRGANVLDMAKVRAVVLETTGDVSVLHGDRLEETILQGTTRLDC